VVPCGYVRTESDFVESERFPNEKVFIDNTLV